MNTINGFTIKASKNAVSGDQRLEIEEDQFPTLSSTFSKLLAA